MKRKTKKRSGPSRIREANEKSAKAKVVRKLCDRIVWLFDMPCNQELDGSEIELSNLIDQISPWQNYVGDEQGVFEKVWEGVKISFGFGYALGQMLDLPEVDITPIREILWEKRALLYMPHEKKAA